MVPSGPHAAVDSPSAGVIACGVPPRASTRFIWPSAKNPIEWLSGDQNGQRARSVPDSGRASAESSACNPECRLALMIRNERELAPVG